MKKILEKGIAIVLSLTMAVGTCVAVASAKDDKEPESLTVGSVDEAVTALADGYVSADDLEKDEVYPTIIIHGIGQADTYILDDNGNHLKDWQGDEITGWPLHFNVPELVLKLILPLIVTLITQEDHGLCDILYDTVYDAVLYNSSDLDGNPMYDIEVEQYDNRPVSECTQEEKDHIYGCIPIEEYGKKVGEENLYYFAYNSFGNTFDIVDDLEVLIEKAKKDTGKDKVNLVPVSLGGAIATVYVNENKGGENINKVVFIVPALDGSEIVGKLMAGELDLSNRGLYMDMFTKLVGVDNYTGWLINIAIRILPKQEVRNILSSVASALSAAILSRSINMWGLVPGSMYDELADKYLPDDTVMRQMADKYHEAQTNLVDNLNAYAAKGIGIYDICGYGCQLYSLIDSDSNSDKIIHSASTSIGATFSKYGKTLGKNYVQQKYSEYNFLSPDGQVDASTCAFPLTTWFFGGQDHERIAKNDVVVRLATTILVSSKSINVYSTPDYPQFNGHRSVKDIRDLLETAAEVDMSALSADDSALLQKAVDNANENLKKTIIIEGETELATAELEAALVQVGAIEAKDTTTDKAMLIMFKTASQMLYYLYGPRGFSDPLCAIVK